MGKDDKSYFFAKKENQRYFEKRNSSLWGDEDDFLGILSLSSS
jgi:hypothetical protein